MKKQNLWRGVLALVAMLAFALPIMPAGMVQAEEPSGSMGPPDYPDLIPISFDWGDPAEAGWMWLDRPDTLTKTWTITTTGCGENCEVQVDLAYAWGQDGSQEYMVVGTDNGDGTYSYSYDFTALLTANEGFMVDFMEIRVLNETGMVADMPIFLAGGLGFTVADTPDDAAGAEGCDATLPDPSTVLKDEADLRTVQFTMACMPKGRIDFTNPIDFTDFGIMQYLHNFHLLMDQTAGEGEMGLSDDAIAHIAQKGARLILYLDGIDGIDYWDTPEILVDGNPDLAGIVSDITYNAIDNSVSFNVAHFSSFSTAPGVTLHAPGIDGKTTSDTVTVSATINGESAVRVYVDDVEKASTYVSGEDDAEVSFEVPIDLGENTIRVTASSEYSSATPVERTVTRVAGSSSSLPAAGAVAGVVGALALMGAGFGVASMWKKK